MLTARSLHSGPLHNRNLTTLELGETSMTHRNTRGTLTRKLLPAMIAGCLLAASQGAHAQAVSGTLRGQVTADAAPAKNATVTVTNTETGLTRTTKSSDDGNYSLAGLPPGTYKIDVDASGKTSTQTVALRVGQTATLDLAVAAAASTEAITVTANRLVETKTSEVATYVDLKQIESLPQNSRNFLQFAETVPGIQFVQSSNGTTELRSGAQSANGVNVYIDGVGQKNYVTRGGVGGQGKLADSSASNKGTRGNPFPQLAIGEYKVITSNYKAEFDQISSAAIVAVTKSGTNDFTADAFYDKTSDAWRASDPFESASGEKAPSDQEQYGLAIGGPIIKDRMHFFATYEKKKIDAPQRVFPGHGVTIPPPYDADADIGNFSEPFDEDLFFGKLDLTLGEAHLFELSAKYRNESDLSFGQNESPSYGTVNDNKEGRYDLRYQYTGGIFLNDAHLTYEDSKFSPRPASSGNAAQLFVGPFDNNNLVLNDGGGVVFDDRDQSGWGLQDDVTFNSFEAAGTHTIKTGVKFKAVSLEVESQTPANPLFAYDINDPTQQPWRVQFGASRIGDLRVKSDNKQYGFYIQDDWDVTNKLQLNLGLRYDYERTPSYLNYQTPQNVIDALNSQNPNTTPEGGHPGAPVGQTYADALALGGLNVSDYLSTGHNRKAFDSGIAPRLGFSYDLFDDQRHVIFGGAGRSYDRNVFEYLARETTKGSFPTYEYHFDRPDAPCPPGTGNCLAWNSSYYSRATLDALAAANPYQGAEVFLLNNDIKTPYSDQFSLGIRDRFTLWQQDWVTSAAVVYNEYKDGIIFLLGQRWPDGTFRLPGTTFGGNPWDQHPAYNGVSLGNMVIGMNGTETRATQLLLSAQKPYTKESGWSATFAYTYTKARENRSNVASQDETYLFDFPTVDGFGWHESTGIPQHHLVATGIVDVPWGIEISGKLSLASPLPISFINCTDASVFEQCFFDVTKPGGTIGFKQFDLAIEKTFTIADAHSVSLRADILNVFNWDNVDTVTDYWGGPGAPNADFLKPSSYLQPTRTFKLSFSAHF
jgi:outer membrane receptor protein involved in Fe transport